MDTINYFRQHIDQYNNAIQQKNNKLKDQYITILDNILNDTINAIQQK